MTARPALLFLGACAALLPGGCGDDAPGGGVAGAGGEGAATTAVTSTGPGTSGAVAGGGGAPPATDELSIITWNLEQFPKAADTIGVVTAAIEELAPDVLALQEIPDEGPAFAQLDQDLTAYEGVLAEEGDGFRRVAMLYRADRVTVDDVTTLFRSDDFAFPRPMLTATVKLGGDDARAVIVGVVHLKANLDDESARRRREACVAIDEWIRTRQGAGVTSPFLIVGDYNDELTDPEEWNVFGPLLDDADGGFLTLALEEAGEHTYLPFDSFIDHALVRGGGAFATGTAEVLHLEDGIDGYVGRVSDHLPVRATLRLPLASP